MHFTEKQIALLLEAVDMLKIDWSESGGHPEVVELEKLDRKLRRASSDPLDHVGAGKL